jgi:hypothetical protein
MIITYYPHSKNIHNLKDVTFNFSLNSKYFSNSKFSKVLITCKWGVMCMTYKKKKNLHYKKQKPKVVSTFWYDSKL